MHKLVLASPAKLGAVNRAEDEPLGKKTSDGDVVDDCISGWGEATNKAATLRLGYCSPHLSGDLSSKV